MLVFVNAEKKKNGNELLNARVATKPIHVNSAVHQRAKMLAAKCGISLGQYTENALRHFAGSPTQ